MSDRKKRECPIGDSAKKGTPVTGIKCADCPDYQECVDDEKRNIEPEQS